MWVCFVASLYSRVPVGEDVKYLDGVLGEVCPLEVVTKLKTERTQPFIIIH